QTAKADHLQAGLLDHVDHAADRALGDGVGFHDSECSLECHRTRSPVCRYKISGATVRPRSAGVAATAMPASLSAAIFSAAVPLPPLMMAPAWPMRLPGGAVCPAMNAATGFFMLALAKRAASSSDVPPISPIIR